MFFPTMSHAQSSKETMVSILRRTIQVSSFILVPLLVGLAAVTEPLVKILLTEKWLPCVFYLQILSFSFVLAPVEIENLQAIKALGRSDIVLKLEIIKRSIGILLLIAAIPFGVPMIAVSLLVGNVLSAMINAYPNRKLLGYTYGQQLQDVLPPILMSMVMYGVVFAVSLLELSVIALLVLQIAVGMATYIVLATVTKNKSLRYILKMLVRVGE